MKPTLALRGNPANRPIPGDRDRLGTFLGWVWALGTGATALLLLNLTAQQESRAQAVSPADVAQAIPDKPVVEG